MANNSRSSSLLLLLIMALSVFVAVLPHYVPIIAYAAPDPSQRRQQQAVTPRPSSSSTEAAAAGVGGVESTPNNNGDEYESRGGATTVRSFATMSSGTTSTDTNNTVPENEGEASMECNQAKELGNVQDVLSDYYPSITADGYYFCSKTAPADFYCYCGVASVCHEFKDPWGRDVGECGCCTQWVYILFGIFMGVVGIVFLCGMFACLCHGTWLYDGHPRPITPLLPQRTAPVIAPAAFPLPANAFRGYRASDFTTAGGGAADQQQPTPTSNATTRPQSPRNTSPSSQSAAARTRSPLPPSSPISPRGGHRVDEEGGTELEQRGLAVASGTHRYSSASAATTPPPPPPLPSNSQTNNTSPTDGGGTSSSRSRGGGGWVYDSDGNLLVEDEEGGGQFSARSGTTAAAAAQSDSRRTTTYSPSTSHEHHHLPVSPTTAAPRTNATLPTANSREEAEQRQFINFDDDEAL